MKVSHAIKVLKNLPQDWYIMWGDSKMILHNIHSVKYNYKENFAEIVLFNNDGCTVYNKNVYTYELINKLSKMSQDADLLFKSFNETNYMSHFDLGDSFIKVKGFRRAKYTDYTCKYYPHKEHYVRIMLFNDELDKKG